MRYRLNRTVVKTRIKIILHTVSNPRDQRVHRAVCEQFMIHFQPTTLVSACMHKHVAILLCGRISVYLMSMRSARVRVCGRKKNEMKRIEIVGFTLLSLVEIIIFVEKNKNEYSQSV